MPSSPTQNDVKICSNALLRLGAKPINSFADETDRSTLCANIYPNVKDNILSLHDWKFSLSKQELNRKADAPISGYSFEYALPANRLTDAVVTLYDNEQAGAQPFKDFIIQGNGILTEATELFMDYQVNSSSEAGWPPYFVEVVVQAMAVELVIPITDQTGLWDKMFQRVYGTVVENGRGGMLGRAMARNSREDPPQVFQDFSLILARAEGS